VYYTVCKCRLERGGKAFLIVWDIIALYFTYISGTTMLLINAWEQFTDGLPKIFG
jgi:hypothetical protein